MESSSDDDFVILFCTNPNPIEPDAKHNQVLISTTDIHGWDLSTILRYQTVKIQAHRNRQLIFRFLLISRGKWSVNIWFISFSFTDFWRFCYTGLLNNLRIFMASLAEALGK